MPIIDYAALPEFPMRAGITGKWIAGHEHGTTALCRIQVPHDGSGQNAADSGVAACTGQGCP